MSQTKIGAIKARDKNLAKNPRYYVEMGRTGGLKKVPKGFAVNRELAKTAGALGGRTSKRTKK